MGRKKITVGIYEENSMSSLGIKTYLETLTSFQLKLDFISSNRDDFEADLKMYSPELLIMDGLPSNISSIDLFTEVFHLKPKVSVLVYSTSKSMKLVETLFSIGVKGYALKTDPISELDKALQQIIVMDEMYLAPSFKSFNKSGRSPIYLTITEKKILLELVKGSSVKKVSNDLCISANTVNFHKKNLFNKFEVNNLVSLVNESLSNGFSRDAHH